MINERITEHSRPITVDQRGEIYPALREKRLTVEAVDNAKIETIVLD